MSRGMLINLKNIKISTLDKTLFEGLSFSVQRGELVALVGANGSGKSSLLQAILARVSGARGRGDKLGINCQGEINAASQIFAGYLPQYLKDDSGLISDLDDLIGCNSPVHEKLGHEFDLSPEATAAGNLSDGERQKLAIIKTLIDDHDLYLFDEPTNYLDIAGITAFEFHVGRLKSRGKGILLVTHDRALTDNLADKTILLTGHGLYQAGGGTSSVFSVRQSDLDSRARQSRDISRKIGRLQEDMRRKAGWSEVSEKRKKGAGADKPYFAKLSQKMAKRAKVAQKRAEKEIDKLEQTRPRLPRKLNLHLPAYKIPNRQVFALRDVSFRYPDDNSEGCLLTELSISGTTRDKICLMGTNGSGKTTILRLIRNELTAEKGSLEYNRGVKTALIPQGLAGFFQEERLLDNFFDCPADQTQIRQYLGAALIRKDKVTQSISNFSNGELMRAAIVKCLLMKAEFLFLDEPTSHLDLESIEILERILQDFTGGYLIISHDRTFVENTADCLYLLDRGRLKLT